MLGTSTAVLLMLAMLPGVTAFSLPTRPFHSAHMYTPDDGRHLQYPRRGSNPGVAPRSAPCPLPATRYLR